MDPDSDPDPAILSLTFKNSMASVDSKMAPPKTGKVKKFQVSKRWVFSLKG
jgi:hypothetical protein